MPNLIAMPHGDFPENWILPFVLQRFEEDPLPDQNPCAPEQGPNGNDLLSLICKNLTGPDINIFNTSEMNWNRWTEMNCHQWAAGSTGFSKVSLYAVALRFYLMFFTTLKIKGCLFVSIVP